MTSITKHKQILENAYKEIFKSNLNKAKELFSSIKDDDPRARWGLNFIGLIEGHLYEYPTYFQLRNFLEIDLDALVKHYKGEYAERIIGYVDFMAQINPEVYKYVGRVLLNNGLKENALILFDMAKGKFYRDPELHYILAELALNMGDIETAAKYAGSCLTILPNYYPALCLLKKINK